MEFVGLLMPMVIDVINTEVSNAKARFWVAFGLCTVVGVLINWMQTSFSYPTPMDAFEGITASVMVVFGLSQISFKAGYQNSTLRKTLTA